MFAVLAPLETGPVKQEKAWYHAAGPACHAGPRSHDTYIVQLYSPSLRFCAPNRNLDLVARTLSKQARQQHPLGRARDLQSGIRALLLAGRMRLMVRDGARCCRYVQTTAAGGSRSGTPSCASILLWPLVGEIHGTLIPETANTGKLPLRRCGAARIKQGAMCIKSRAGDGQS